MNKLIIAIICWLTLINPILGKSTNTPLSKKVYLRIKNQSTRTIEIKEGLFWKTTKILEPGAKLEQYQINNTISDLQILYKKGGIFIPIPDRHCHTKFFLATYEATIKENKYNLPNEENGKIDLNIPPFCKLSAATEKYYSDSINS